MANKNASVEVTGARELRRRLNRMEKGLGGREMKAVHLKVAKLVEKPTRFTTPVRSGRLRDSIRGKATTRTATISAGKASVPYTGVIHFGWPAHNIRPNRFLYRGIGQTPFTAIIEEYSDGVDEIARRVGLQ